MIRTRYPHGQNNPGVNNRAASRTPGGQPHIDQLSGARPPRRFPSVALWVPAIALGLWCLPAMAAPPSNSTYRSQSVAELLNTDTTSGQLSGAKTAGSYGAQQILADAQLASQLESSAAPADSDSQLAYARLRGTKEHHLNPLLIVVAAGGAILLAFAMVLLIWSRIVHNREMRDVPAPMAFNYPRI